MKFNSTNTSRNKIAIIAVAVILLVIGLGTAYAINQQNKSATTEKYSPPTAEEKQAGEDIKKQVIENSDDKPVSGSDPSPEPVEQADGSKSVVVVNVLAAMRNGDSYRVQTLIQTVTNSGLCTIVITDSEGKVYRATADVQALPSSSTCKGFTIPVSELSVGKWNINLQFENDSVRGSVEKEMEVS